MIFFVFEKIQLVIFWREEDGNDIFSVNDRGFRIDLYMEENKFKNIFI